MLCTGLTMSWKSIHVRPPKTEGASCINPQFKPQTKSIFVGISHSLASTQRAHTARATGGLGRAGRPARSSTAALERRDMASIPTQGRLRCPHPPAGGAALRPSLELAELVGRPFAPPRTDG